MKLFLLMRQGHDENHIYGIYEDKEIALADAHFIMKHEIDFIEDLRKEINEVDEDERFVIHPTEPDHWNNEFRSRYDNKWGDWCSVSCVCIIEYDTRSMSLEDKVNAVNAWQNSCTPMICGINYLHPYLVPKFMYYNDDIGLTCIEPNCDYEHRYIPEIVYASYLSNRPSTT